MSVQVSPCPPTSPSDVTSFLTMWPDTWDSSSWVCLQHKYTWAEVWTRHGTCHVTPRGTRQLGSSSEWVIASITTTTMVINNQTWTPETLGRGEDDKLTNCMALKIMKWFFNSLFESPSLHFTFLRFHTFWCQWKFGCGVMCHDCAIVAFWQHLISFDMFWRFKLNILQLLTFSVKDIQETLLKISEILRKCCF